MKFWNYHWKLPSRKMVSLPAQACGLISGHGDRLRNDKTCSWRAASNRRVSLYARAAFQAPSVATPHGFPGAVVLPAVIPYVGAALIMVPSTVSLRSICHSPDRLRFRDQIERM
jgi:hypothetical protein